MSAKYDLTQGPIFGKLFRLSMPIMATSLMQSAHNLTAMFWLGFLGEEFVAAAGLSGLFLWLSMGLSLLCRIGAEIGVSQNMGRGEPQTAKSYAQNGFMLSLIIGLFYTAIVLIFRSQLLGFMDTDNPEVQYIGQQYLAIVVLSVPFNFGHFVITGVFNGFGNTKMPFYINSAALLLNIILGPILIFGANMGVLGAAVAMVAASAFNFSLKVWAITKYKNRPFEDYKLFVKAAATKIRQIAKWGIPVAAESMLFTLLYILVTRLIASFGYGAVAAHSVGTQVESLSFMIGGGFASAITAFVGQNYGAKKWGRLRQTYHKATIFMACYGVVITVVLFVFADPLVSIFLTNPDSIQIGGDYLRVIALAQLLFCMEGVATGSFRGRGLTIKPTIASVSSNVFRVIVCYALAATALGIMGIWWGIFLAMTLRSVWLLVWHFLYNRKQPRVDHN